MRRKSTRNSTKASPEKTKEEKPAKKLRRTRRQKRSSSESDSDDDAPLAQTIEHHSEDSKGFDDDAVQHHNETQKTKTRAVPGTPERTSKRLRNKSVTLLEEEEEKTTRRSKRRGGTPKLEDIDEEDVDVEEKRAKGKSKGKNKSKIDQTSQISETEIPSDNSENAQVTAQSPHIDNVANNDDADNVGVNQMDDGSDKDKKHDNIVETPSTVTAETESEAEIKPPDSVDESKTIKDSPDNAANSTTNDDSSSIPKAEDGSTATETVNTEAEPTANSGEKQVDTDGIQSTDSGEKQVDTDGNQSNENLLANCKIETESENNREKLGTDVEMKETETSKAKEAAGDNEEKKEDENKSKAVSELQSSTTAEATEVVESSMKDEVLEKTVDQEESAVTSKIDDDEKREITDQESNEITEEGKSIQESKEVPVDDNNQITEKENLEQKCDAASKTQEKEEVSESRKKEQEVADKCEAQDDTNKTQEDCNQSEAQEVCNKSNTQDDCNKSNTQDGCNNSKIQDDCSKSDTRDDSNKSDTRDDSNKPDARDDSNKSDTRNDSNKPDARDDSNKSDARDDSDKPDARDDSNKSDARDDSNKPDARDDSNKSETREVCNKTKTQDDGDNSKNQDVPEVSENCKTEEEVVVPEERKITEVDEKREEDVSQITPPAESTDKKADAEDLQSKEFVDKSNSTTEVANKTVEKMDVDESIDFTKPPDDSGEVEKVQEAQRSAAYKTLLEEIIQKNQNERPVPEMRKINIRTKRRRSDNSDGQEDASIPVKKWSFKFDLLLVTSDAFISMYPELSLLNEEEVKLERKDRRPTVSSEYERKAEEYAGDSREAKESEASVENIIAMNRKISIVDDDASKLKPPPSPAKNEKSAVLFITNLVRPFTIKQLRELLERTGNIKEEGFWTDRIKSKCYVQYQTVEEAEATRNALHGVHWPICNGKKLIIDYSTVEDLEMAKNPPPVVPVATAVPEKENQEPDTAPAKKSHKDELDSEKEAKLKANNSWEMDSVKEEAAHVRRSRSKERMDKRRYSRSRHSRSSSEADYGKKKQKKVEEAVPQRAMDDLFRKTEATPCIYWQPLSPEEIALKQQQRLERMAEHKRRMETQTRNKRGPEHSRGGPYRRRY